MARVVVDDVIRHAPLLQTCVGEKNDRFVWLLYIGHRRRARSCECRCIQRTPSTKTNLLRPGPHCHGGACFATNGASRGHVEKCAQWHPEIHEELVARGHLLAEEPMDKLGRHANVRVVDPEAEEALVGLAVESDVLNADDKSWLTWSSWLRLVSAGPTMAFDRSAWASMIAFEAPPEAPTLDIDVKI